MAVAIFRPCLVRSLPEDDLASFCEERIGLARISEAVAGEDRTACDDVRTLEVTYGQNGERQRSFRETVKELTQTEFPDFPLRSQNNHGVCQGDLIGGGVSHSAAPRVGAWHSRR